MAKTIVKEIIIGLLLCLAILLVLAVLMYSYIPNNKLIPELISYSAPEEAKKVLEEAAMDASQVILTYEVNSSDLSTAQRTNDYNPGKVNPFSSYQVQTTTEQGNTAGNTTNATSAGGSTATSGEKTTANTTNGGSTTNNTTTNSTSSGGTYFKDKGTK